MERFQLHVLFKSLTNSVALGSYRSLIWKQNMDFGPDIIRIGLGTLRE